ncbi:uncharacterized protein LOC135499238 [Lineus longissimus]|uniref:uncharacterized protein LOC135499238 n=1 Tax=Lineus longissimus TaxID=88925 RepID=UPI002B4E41CA
MIMECMRIGPEKVDAMVDYAFGHNLSLNEHALPVNGQSESSAEAVNIVPRTETLGGSSAYAEEYEDELNGQAKGGVTDNLHDLNDNMEEPDMTPTTENSRSPVKTPIEQTSNYPRLPSSLEASTGSGYFYDDDFSTQLGGDYAAIDMDTFENEDISSFFAVYNNQAPENKMMLVRTRSDSALYNYDLELSMSERTSSRGQSSSGYDCASSAELSFRSDQVYSPGMTHSSLQSGPLFSSSQDGVVPQNLYSTDSLDRTDLDCSIATEDDFNLKACYANKKNYFLAFDRSPTKYSDDEQEYHDAWLSDATESLEGVQNAEEEEHTDSEYMCSEMDHSAGEMVCLDDYYSNEHEPLLAEHMLLSAEHENILPEGAAGAAAEVNWIGSVEEISVEFHSDDTQVVPEDCGYRSASDQDDSAINVQDVPDIQDDSVVLQDTLDASADNTMDDYDSQLLDEIEQELQISADVSESFAYDNLTFEEDASLHASVENVGGASGATGTGLELWHTVNLKKMAASDSARLISPDYEMMYSYPEGLSEVLAGRMNGGRLLKRWRNIQQNLHDLSSSEPITMTDPTDSIEPRAALTPLGTFTLKGGAANDVSKPMTCWGQKFSGALDVPERKEKEFHSSDSTLENISWTSRENSGSELETPSVSSAPKSLTTWQQVKKARTPHTSWKEIMELKQFLRDEELLASSSSKCKSAPNLAQECDSASEGDDLPSICYRQKREKQEDAENKRHSFTLFEIFRRSKSEDQEYGKLPSPIYQKLYGSLMANDGYFLNHLGDSQSFNSEQRSVGINRSYGWSTENDMDGTLQHSQSSSINKINSCTATPGGSDNSCGSSPSSDANLVPPPYGHHAIDGLHQGTILDGETLQAHNARTSGLMQRVSLLPIIQANFNRSDAATQPTESVLTTFANQGTKAASLKRDLTAMQRDEQPSINNAYKHRLLDQNLVESGGKFIDSITSFSGDTISKPVYTTSSPNVFCRAVQTSISLTQAGKVQQECQTSFDKTLCDEQFLSVERPSPGQHIPIPKVGNSPTSQGQSVQNSQGSQTPRRHSKSTERLGCTDDIFSDDARPSKDKLSRSLMFMNTRLPDLSFLNPRGMSKSSVQGEQNRFPQRSQSCDYSQGRREEVRPRYLVKPKKKIVVIEDERASSASLTDAEALATAMQQEKPVAGAARNPPEVLMNNELLDNRISGDSVAKGSGLGGRKIEIVRNGKKAGKLGNKMTNLEKDNLEKGKHHQAVPRYYGNMSSTASSMDISSDSQASHNNGVLDTPRMSRRDAHGQGNHHARCSSRSHDHHGHHSNHYNVHSNQFESHHSNRSDTHHGNNCFYQNPGFCQNCFMVQQHAMLHLGSPCGRHHHSPHPDNCCYSNHSMTSPDGYVYYSDEDHHSRRSNRGYNTHRADRIRRSSTDTDNSSQDSDAHLACDDGNRPSNQSLENQASCNESETSSSDGRQLKPIIKQRKRRAVSAPGGTSTHRQDSSLDRSSDTTTASEKSSERGSDREALSDDGAPTIFSAENHTVARGNGHHQGPRKTSGSESADNRIQDESYRRNYSVNLRNESRLRHSYSQCCPLSYQHYQCCMPPSCFHGYGHMMCCCHGNSFCCGGYNARLRRSKKSVSFSEEIKYHSPYSSPHCSPKKQQKPPLQENGRVQRPPLLQENGRVQCDERKERNRTERVKTGAFYPETHASESSVDSAIGSESPPREFQISPTRRKKFDYDETRQNGDYGAKKNLVLEVGRAVEVVQSHYSQAMNSQERVHLGTSSDCPKVGSLLLSHVCPALYNLLGDGLKPRTHSFIGQIKNNLWKVVEESAEQCIAVSKVMIEIVKEVKSQICLGSPLSKFNAFIFGLLNAKALDHWLTIFHTQEKILKKHYNNDAFVVLALATRGQYLFEDVVNLCRPLASLPFRVECSFEFKFRHLSPRREATFGAEPFRKNSRLRRQRSLDELDDKDGKFEKWNGRLQLVQTSNSTLTSSDTSSRDITSSEDYGGKCQEPVLPELFQKTDVKQYIQQAREWIENGTKISDSAMDYLGQHFHRDFGQFSQHPAENNRWSLPPIETVFSLANFFSKSSLQNESPSIEGFAMYLARISADADNQGEMKAVAGMPPARGSAEKMSPCEEIVAELDESAEDDLISFEDDSKGTLKDKSGDVASSGSDVASLSSEGIKVEQLIKDNEIVSPRLLELDDEVEKKYVNPDWLIKFKGEEDITYKSTEYEFDGKLSLAIGGEDSMCEDGKMSQGSNASFDQHLQDMGIRRDQPIRRENHGVKRLSCPLLRFTNESGRDEQHPKRWSLGASLINVFDKLLLDSPQKVSPASSGTFCTPPGGHILDSPNLMNEVTSSESESFRSAISCGDFGFPTVPVAPLKPISVSPPSGKVQVVPKSASVAVRPKELPLRRSTMLMPKSMSSSMRSDDSQTKALKRYVKALCGHKATDSEQLSFEKGDVMMTMKELDDDWYFCCHGNKTGVVNQSCVKEIDESEVLRRLNNSMDE